MPLDMAARAPPRADRSMLAAAFILLAFRDKCSTIGASADGTRVLLVSQFGFGSVPWAHGQRSRAESRKVCSLATYRPPSVFKFGSWCASQAKKSSAAKAS